MRPQCCHRLNCLRAHLAPPSRGLSAVPVGSSVAVDGGMHPLLPQASPHPLDAAAMRAHQASLPKLPLAPLEVTLKALREVVAPLATPSQLAEFDTELARFAAGDGPRLQDELAAMDARLPHTTYVTGFWNDSYFGGRYPVAINGNPFVRFHPMTKGGTLLRQHEVAARLAHAAAVITANLYGHTYDVDVEGGRPMCMGQFGDILASCRIPQRGRDGFSSPATRGSVPTHVTVLRGDKVFEVPVMRARGVPASPSHPQAFDIVPVADLEAVMLDVLAVEDTGGPSLADLTTLDRDSWADARAAAVQASPDNAALLASVESSLVALSLPDFVPETPDEAARLCLHGHRDVPMWFDKFCMVVCEGGLLGGAFEHSGYDGHAFRRVIEELYTAGRGMDSAKGLPPLAPQTGVAPPSPARMLPLRLTPALEATISAAAEEMQARRDNIELASLVISRVTKADVKRAKMSPDAFAQLAMQIAYKRAFDPPTAPSVYESCSMRHFIDGRTETIRPVTDASQRAARFMNDSMYHTAERREALYTASEAHVARCRAAASGKGVDRHMYALMCLELQRAGDVPRLFKTAAMQKLSAIDISTSTINADCAPQMGFGPVSERGIGVAYHVQDSSIRFTVTAFKLDSGGAPTGRSTAAYVAALESTVRDMAAVLNSGV